MASPIKSPAAGGVRPRATVITAEQVEAAIASLPHQGRIMMRLLLLQYLDLDQEDLEYIAMDRPDPRFHAGGKPLTPYLSREAVQGISARVAQYRDQIRYRRERAWTQGEVLGKQIARSETILRVAERLLRERFQLGGEAIDALKKQARTAVPRPQIRELDSKWDRNDIAEDEYRSRRLQIEFQSYIRRLEREHRRLELAQREFDLANLAPLQDHEIAQVWGLPISSLAGRKVKHLHQYLEAIQKAAQANASAATQPPVDLWKETFVALSAKPIQRTPAIYDGLQGTEGAFIEKLMEYAEGRISEDKETQFWVSISMESDPQTEHGSRLRSLFAIQRLSAILSDMDSTDEGVEQELLLRVTPKAKDVPAALEDKPAELGELGEHVLKSFLGEDHTDTRARR